MKKRIVSLLISIILLLSIIAGITVSAQASVAGIPYLSPLKNKYVIGEGANQFDFFEKYIAIEAMKEWEQNVYSRPSIEASIIDEYAQKIGVVGSNGKANTNLGEYARIAKIYQYAHLTHTYSTSQESGWDVAIFIRSGICQTFSGIINEFCKRAGIECWQIWGGADHAWNVVKLDGKYYAIDVARNKFLTEPSAGVTSWKTDATTVTSANDGTCYDSSTGSGTGVQQWINKVGSSNLATSTYSKTKIDEHGELVNPSITLATPSVVSTTATDEGVVVKFKGVSNADWYEVYTAPIDGVMSNVSIERWGEKTNYSGDFVYYKQSYMEGDFKFTKSATIHSIDKNESGQYQCFLENDDGNGLIVFVVAKNVNGECNLATDFSAITGATNNEKLISLIGKNYLKPADEGKDKTSGKTITDATAAQINSTNYTLYKANAKHLAANGNHAYSKVVTVRTAGAGTQGAEVYECKNCLQREMRYTAALSTSSLATPKISSIYADNAGTIITWGKVSGAQNYRVYRKTSNTDWAAIGTTTGTTITDKTAVKGTKYFYTVRCLSADAKSYTSGYDTKGTAFTAYATPKISSISANNSGTVITWGKVSGAAKYRVFYKIGNGAWTKITDTTSTSYTWKDAKAGTKYTYTVRCISSDGKVYTSGFESAGKTFTTAATPKISSVVAENSGTVINWKAATGAQNYRVYRKTASGDWVAIATTKSTSFIDKTAAKGTKYFYTVRCLTADSKTYTSGYDTKGTAFTAYATPKISSISVNNSGTVITWGKVNGAAKYRVFYKIGNGAWTKITDTTSTSYTWKDAKAGTKYTYTVRCVSSDGKVYTSGFESAGKTFTTAATPKISSIYADNSGTVISWKAATGAQNYRVYRKTAGGDWVAIATTKSTGFTDKTAAKGTKYIYTVRCLTADSKTYASGYDTNGTAFTACAAPKLTVVSSGATSITISWNKVAGAQKYRVFYRNSSGGWTKLGDTTATSFTCNGAKPGTRYTYTVRCVNSAGTVYTSGWDNAGKSIVK